MKLNGIIQRVSKPYLEGIMREFNVSMLKMVMGNAGNSSEVRVLASRELAEYQAGNEYELPYIELDHV